MKERVRRDLMRNSGSSNPVVTILTAAIVALAVAVSVHLPPDGQRASLPIGQAVSPTPPHAPTTPGTPSPDDTQRRAAWHISMASIPLPKKGCFTASYPSTQWQGVPCITAPPYPQPPRHGSKPSTVGNGNDVSASAPAGLISSATGSFDSVTGVTSESGLINNTGQPVANAYTIQVNTNPFGSNACSGSPNTGCQGWEQFVFENNGTSGSAYIQYWLLQYDATCPTATPAWIQFSFPGSTDIYCYKNSTNASAVPNEPITNLANLSLTGTVAASGDNYFFSTTDTFFAASGDNVVNAAAGWNAAEFTVVGDGGSGQANFNDGSTIVSRERITYSGTAAPNCVASGYTGETNNLSFGPIAPAATGPGAALLYTESSAGGATSNCAAAAGWGAFGTFVGSLVQMHTDGSIWQYTGTGQPCQQNPCPGWVELDNNPLTSRIFLSQPGSGILLQLHSDGSIYQYTGQPCQGTTCSGWVELDNNPATVAISASSIGTFQLHSDGSIWQQYVGQPCQGNTCSGWVPLDNNPASIAISAGATGLFQLHNDGSIYQYSGQPCQGATCSGWVPLDNNPAAVAINAGTIGLFQLHHDGSLYQYTGQPCQGNSCLGWVELDNNPATILTAQTGGGLFQFHGDRSIWQYTGPACQGSTCSGWVELDNNPAAVLISTGNAQLFQLHTDGSIWQSNGMACQGTSCPGWVLLDNNPATIQINNNKASVITVSPSTLANGRVGSPYSQTLTASSTDPFSGAFTFNITAGALPNGLILSNLGAITGTPTAAGQFNFTIQAMDSHGFVGSRAYSVSIVAPRIDTIGIFRSGTFYLRLHNSTGFADITVAFNPATKPYPVVGDWTGAGFDTVGVYDQSNGVFSLCTANNTTSCANAANRLQFVLGIPNDQPLAGRWNAAFSHFGGGVFRPSNGLIYLKNALTTGFADYTMVLGIPGDVGLAGDWNGDGLDSLGVYRPSNSTFYLNDQTCNCSLIGTYQFAYGLGGDAPVVGDWVGQGHDGVGLFRKTNGYTYLRNSLTTGFADIAFVYGIAGDVPVAGHWQLTYPPVAEYRAGQVAAPTTTAPTSAPVPTGVGD